MNTEDKTLSPEDFKGKKLFIAPPCYGGMASVEFISSLCNLINYLSAFKIEYYLALIGNESLITRARNTLTAQFMAKEYSHLMFIDADIEFKPEDVVTMLYHDKPVLCGAYPLKGLPIKYVLSLKSNEPVENKFAEVHDAGTGFMMIKRETIQKMFEAYPELKYTLNDDTKTVVNLNNLNDYAYTLFDTATEELEDGSKVYLSEDYLFCRRWQNIGGKVLMDPKISLNHVGTYKFQGSKLTDILKPKSELDKDAEKDDN